MIRGIKFGSIPVRDQERALKFYTEALGFNILTDQPMGDQRWIELGIPGANPLSFFLLPRSTRLTLAPSRTFHSGATTQKKRIRNFCRREWKLKGCRRKCPGVPFSIQDPDGNQFILSSK